MLHVTISKDKLLSNQVIFRDDLRLLELTDTAHKRAYMPLMLLQYVTASYTKIFQTDRRLLLNQVE